MAREVEVRSRVVGHHYGRDTWVVEAEELRELEQEDGLADGSDAVEDHEGVYDARAFGVPDEAVAEEEEDQVYPEGGDEDEGVAKLGVVVERAVEVGSHFEHSVVETGRRCQFLELMSASSTSM